MIVTDIRPFDRESFTKPFVHEFFGDKTLPSGNVITYVAPNETVGQKAESALHFQWEIASVDGFGGAAINRLFIGIMADKLAGDLKCQTEIRDDSVLIHKDHTTEQGLEINVGVVTCDVVSREVRSNHTIGHAALYLKAGSEAFDVAFPLGLEDNMIRDLMQYGVTNWYNLLASLHKTYYRNL